MFYLELFRCRLYREDELKVKRTTAFLLSIRRVIKLHEYMLKEICEEYGLTLIEATIISFLHNNPGKDTAADIVELRMLSKGNVSQAVESLIRKSLLERKPDTEDRRRLHLSLCPAAFPIIESMDILLGQFQNEIFEEVSEKEREDFHRIGGRITENASKAMAKRTMKYIPEQPEKEGK